MKKNLLWIISLAMTAALLVLIFRKIDPARVLASLEDARIIPLLSALAVSFLTNCLLAAIKWRRILAPLGLKISIREAFLVKMGSAPWKSLLPFRSGETSRVIYLKRRHHFSAARATGSILLELVLNIFVFLLFIVAGGAACAGSPPRVLTATALVLAAGGAVFLAAGRAGPRRWVRWGLDRIPSPRFRGGLETLLTFHRYFPRREILPPLFYSLVIQAGKLLSFFLIATAFRLTFSPVIYLVILPFSILVSTIPITFLGIGLREGSLVELVPLYSSLPAAAILGPALIFSLVEYLFPALLGLLWTARFSRRLLEKPGR
ncbi:MAG: lysylphosphatidylglycerol synthase transmembrane domain-containing protein [Candidatus Erginobacter occultus]|nr:lysylphosphatidylglycerol synthase transmembrane domain-containing protein [Candidatus Erginobacter occultus]